MAGRRVLTGLFCGVLICLMGTGAGAQGDDGKQVIASVAGHKITLEQLDQRESGRLLSARNQYYLAQRDALQDLIDEYVLEQEAKRQKISADALLEREVYGKIKDPSEDQMEVYYEALDTNQPFTALRDKILDHIRKTRRAKARSEYVRKLRAAQPVTILLEPPTAAVALGDAPRRGASNAPVVLVEFADYQCPYCLQIEPALEKLRKEFADNLTFVFKDLPLPSHPNAQKAAEAAHCAGAQGKFWEYHDALFANPSSLGLPELNALATRLKLDPQQFGHCLESGQQAAAVAKSFAQAQALGLTGTPSFFVNDHFLSGADYATLEALIKQQLVAKPAVARADP